MNAVTRKWAKPSVLRRFEDRNTSARRGLKWDQAVGREARLRKRLYLGKWYVETRPKNINEVSFLTSEIPDV